MGLIARPAEHERDAAEQQSIREILDAFLTELEQVFSISPEKVLPRPITEQQLSGPDRSGLINHLSEYARIQPQSHFLPAAFARSADGIGVGGEVAAFAAQQHAALEAVEEFDFHDEDAEVALEGLGGCCAGEFVEVGEGEEAADWTGLHRVVVEDVFWEGWVDCFSASLAEGPASEPVCVWDCWVDVDEGCCC